MLPPPPYQEYIGELDLKLPPYLDVYMYKD